MSRPWRRLLLGRIEASWLNSETNRTTKSSHFCTNHSYHTFESLHNASEFIRVIEQRQGYKIGCIGEIAWRKGFIDRRQLDILAEGLIKSGYGEYLRRVGK